VAPPLVQANARGGAGEHGERRTAEALIDATGLERRSVEQGFCVAGRDVVALAPADDKSAGVFKYGVEQGAECLAAYIRRGLRAGVAQGLPEAARGRRGLGEIVEGVAIEQPPRLVEREPRLVEEGGQRAHARLFVTSCGGTRISTAMGYTRASPRKR